ncbi:MAG TPA: alpha-glucan family phosphorylase [Streptosporangiaceae bacterium]|nr:alpha-glucan family phosphorylase [Streptosporangiaceae bacterium]
MKAIRRFTVRTVLPGPLAPLHGLMLNLRWSWHSETADLFESIDPEAWQASGADPVAMLSALQPARLAALAADQDFLRRLHAAVRDLEDYLAGPRWYQHVRDQRPDGDGGLAAAPSAIAYFSPEYGITEVLPQYSGGLGILAGDHLKAASDLGVPLIGVGLLYRHGYFTQSLSADGWQAERYPASDPNGLPLELLRDGDGAEVRVGVTLADGNTLAAQVWLAKVGRVPLLLLDSYVEENEPALHEVTDRLYGGGTDHRLRQELLLGIGGMRAVRAFCAITGHPEPEVFHTNEGHAGFLGLERIRTYVADGLSFDEALEACRAGTVFTTHTPVPAGIDRFPRDLIERHFSGAAADPALPADRVLSLGAETYPGGDPHVFNMAVMGMRLAQRVNGVSRLHGAVSRSMFAGLWPGFEESEVPIGSITNGVHPATWVAREFLGLAYPGPATLAEDGNWDWDRAAELPAERLWQTRRAMRAHLVAETRKRLRVSWRQRGASEAELTWIDDVLDEDTLTIGFARRVPSYKRLTLMLHDQDRLTELLLDPERPVQIVIAGKAHPADEGGKRLIQQMVRFTDDPRVRTRIVFLPDYDMEMARSLVRGCDVWLNNPLRPLEACGTSGMKAALNGGLNVSVRDGWWDEWFDGANGWEIPSADGVPDPDRRDELESTALYELLENSVAPLFYDRDAAGVPSGWVEMIRHTLRVLGPRVPAERMVRQYVTTLYAPATGASRALAGDGTYEPARELAAWKQRVVKSWPGVHIEHVEGDAGEPRLGSPLTVRVTVALGELTPDDVCVEVVYGRANEHDELVDPCYIALSPDVPASGEPDGHGDVAPSGAVRYAGEIELARPGPFGYTVRVLPRHPLLASRAELGLVTAPDAPAGMTNGDLR